MHHRLLTPSLFLAALALVVSCGSPFEAGAPAGLSGDDDGGDAGGVTNDGPDGSTILVPPNGGSSSGGSGTKDASTDATTDGRADGASEADASDDATLNEPPDAAHDAADASPEPPDTGPVCTATEKLCGDQCVAKSSAATGCAATSCSPCSLEHTTTATCDTSGACAPAVCAAGYEHCTGPGTGGCETSISTATNCGSCGHACDASNPYCAASGNTFACTNGCPVGSVLCNSACVNESTSVADCGGCSSAAKSFACTAPSNASPTCSASTCSFTCNGGFNECNGNECVSFTSDPKNCGSCNHACPIPANGAATCSSVGGVGTCGISCDSGLSACGGVCVNEMTDNGNCGACGKTCGAVANGSDQCTSGSCKVTCATNYSLCNTNECVNESNDNNNCGACGKVCPAPPAFGTDNCVSSACTVACNAGYQLCNGACVQADPAEVFVSGSSTLTSGCGVIGTPCKTIAAGIAYATANGKSHIYVDKGTYAEQVNLANGITLEGGWIYGGGSTWTKECVAGVDPSAGTIIAPTSVSSAVLANDVTATLMTLTVHNETTSSPGESSYGVFANGAHLTLNAVEVISSAGGNGTAGGAGSTPAGPVPPCSPSDGLAGHASANASGFTASQYLSAGYSPGAGNAGPGGVHGDNGTAGKAPTCATAQVCSSDSLSCIAGTTPECGTPGTSGCGGPGGPGGLGGSGGGASIALYAWGSTVSVAGGSLTSGNGGNGGPGGNGAALAAATTWANSAGAAGTGGKVRGCTTNTTDSQCALLGSGAAYAGGGAGGPGGAGAAGGYGMSGPGGDSYAYYSGTGSTVTLSGSPKLTAGVAGKTTGPNPSTAVSGTAALHN